MVVVPAEGGLGADGRAFRMQTLRGKLLAIHRRRRHLRLGRRWYTRIGTTAPEDVIGWRAARPATRSLQVIDKSFEELIAEAGAADVAGWDFSWLDGRATEERPPWGYQKLMGEKLGRAALTLDIQTSGGEALAESRSGPARPWSPPSLGPRTLSALRRTCAARAWSWSPMRTVCRSRKWIVTCDACAVQESGSSPVMRPPMIASTPAVPTCPPKRLP